MGYQKKKKPVVNVQLTPLVDVMAVAPVVKKDEGELVCGATRPDPDHYPFVSAADLPLHMRLGHKKGTPDARDFKFAVPPHLAVAKALGTLPSKVDLTPLMPPVYDQSDLGSCHDDETEVLTSRGWMKFINLTGNERLASVDPSNSVLCFEKPVRLVRHHYKGDMYHGFHGGLDFCVTPDHNMLVRKLDAKKEAFDEDYNLIAASKLGWYCRLMNSVNYNGEGRSETYELHGVDHKHKPQRSSAIVSMSAWLKFIGIYLAEGTMLVGDRNKYKIQIAAVKDRERQYVEEVLSELGIKYTSLKDRFTFCNHRLYGALAALGLRGVKAPVKFVPEFIFNLPGDQISLVIEGHFMGDGCEQDGCISHYTSSPQLAEDLQRLLFLSGSNSHVSVRATRQSIMKDGRVVTGRHPEHRVGVCNRRELCIDRKKHVTTRPYDGEVFCAEMPTHHTLVTRRNNKILISGNCTANAIGGLVEFLLMKQKRKAFVPSRLFIYYCERVIEQTVNEDAGAQIRDGMKVVNSIGCPDEAIWWYNIRKYAVRPAKNVYAAAAATQVSAYYAVNHNLDDMRACLANGNPFVFGFDVYASFDNIGGDGIMPMPNFRWEGIKGGHAIMAVGYDNATGYVKIRNSWGASWGDHGYFYMPYDYIVDQNACSDFWTATQLTQLA